MPDESQTTAKINKVVLTSHKYEVTLNQTIGHDVRIELSSHNDSISKLEKDAKKMFQDTISEA